MIVVNWVRQLGELNKLSDFSELDVIGELVEFDDVMKRCSTRPVGSGGQGVGLQGTRRARDNLI